MTNIDNITSIRFTGNLTIDHASELASVLRDSLNRVDHLSLFFEDVTEVDISFLQLLCSAHRTAVKSNKTLVLDRQRPEPLRLAMREAAFTCEAGCVFGRQQSCIWKEGWKQ